MLSSMASGESTLENATKIRLSMPEDSRVRPYAQMMIKEPVAVRLGGGRTAHDENKGVRASHRLWAAEVILGGGSLVILIQTWGWLVCLMT